MKYHRTGYKVEVKDGMQRIVRTVYETETGKRFFKHEGEPCYIEGDEVNGYRAMFFKGVRYIAEE